MPTEYKLTITATGEVRDADGNLLNTEPLEATTVVSAEQAAQLLAKSGLTPPEDQ